MTVMKPLLLMAVQAQLVPLAVMTMLLVPPVLPKLALVTEGVTLQATAASVTVKVCPATVIEPV